MNELLYRIKKLNKRIEEIEDWIIQHETLGHTGDDVGIDFEEKDYYRLACFDKTIKPVMVDENLNCDTFLTDRFYNSAEEAKEDLERIIGMVKECSI